MHTFRQVSRLAIWGFGSEGRAALNFVAERYPRLDVTILDENEAAADGQAPGSVRFIGGKAAVSEAVSNGGFDLIVKSPGVSLYRPEIESAKAKGVRFTSVLNLWFETNPGVKTVAVTGTKGKSTTVRLLHHLLRQQGLDVQLLGNVGIPALGHAPGRDHTLMELSSYQIADLEHAPDVAVVTNLFPEHAPWHGGVERYYADKLRLLTLDKRTRVVANFGDAGLHHRLPQLQNVTWFNAPEAFAVQAGRLTYAGREIAIGDMPLKGEHNLSNLAAACTTCEVLGIHAFRQELDLAGFRQLRHRLEELQLPSGVLVVNDSISTVPQSTMAALKAFADRDTVLLLGGNDRGQDYSDLLEFLPSTRVQQLVLLPQNGSRILSEATRRSLPIPAKLAADLDEAVRIAFEHVPRNGLVLLSPAAPSFPEFRNFEERGERFKVLCSDAAGLTSRSQHMTERSA